MKFRLAIDIHVIHVMPRPNWVLRNEDLGSASEGQLKDGRSKNVTNMQGEDIEEGRVGESWIEKGENGWPTGRAKTPTTAERGSEMDTIMTTDATDLASV